MNDNYLTVYCNFDIPPFESTLYLNGMSPIAIETTFDQVVKFIQLSSLPYETAMRLVKDYYNLCFSPSPAVQSLDPQGYVIHNLDLTKYALRPLVFKQLAELIVNAVEKKLVKKHVRINTNSMEFVNMIRYVVFESKLYSPAVSLNINTSSAGQQSYGIDECGKFVNLDGEPSELPEEFTAPTLQELLRMM